MTTVEVGLNPSSATVDSGSLRPSVLDPDNLQTYYDEERNAFVSEWFEETTPVPEDTTREIVVSANLRNIDTVTVFVERDDIGDGTVDDRSETYQVGNNLIEPLESIEPIEDSRYRIVFPEYNRDNEVDLIRLSLTWDNHSEIKDSFPLRGIDLDGGFLGDVLSVYASELYNLDTRIDEEYDTRFLSAAKGDALTRHGVPVDVHRNPAEEDQELRERISVEYALYISDGTLSSFENIISRIFDEPRQLTVDVHSDEPKLIVEVPFTELDKSLFTRNTIESKLEQAMPSSYSVRVDIVEITGALGISELGTGELAIDES